jgi:hypothetical protein
MASVGLVAPRLFVLITNKQGFTCGWLSRGLQKEGNLLLKQVTTAHSGDERELRGSALKCCLYLSAVNCY